MLPSSEVRRTYELMNTGQALKNLTDSEVQRVVKRLVAAIGAVTGCFPDKSILLITLKSIKNFLLTHYHFMTEAELVEAFEMNIACKFEDKVEHYGRALNVDYIGKVLSLYRAYRRTHMQDIIAAFRQATPPSEVIQQPAEQFTDEHKREMIQLAYDMFRTKAGDIIGSQFIYNYCVSLKVIEDDSEKFVERARAQLIARYYMELQRLVNHSVSDENYQYNQSGAFSGSIIEIQRKIDALKVRPHETEIQREIFAASKAISLQLVFKKFVDSNVVSIFETPI